MEGTIAKSRNKKDTGTSSMQSLVKQMEPAIRAALPSVITPERFSRIILSCLSRNPKLASCTSGSFLGAMMTAAQLGVEPNTPLGQAYFIPYYNHGVLECQFQLGYKGLIDLAYRSGNVKTIQANTVYANDEFEYELGLEPKLRHVPKMEDRGDPVYFYAVFRTKDDGYGFAVMSIDDVRQHAKKYSKAKTGPWQTNFEEMAKKTVLKKALKYAPISTDFQRNVSTDETIKHVTRFDDVIPDMASVPDDTEYQDVEYEETGADDAPASGEDFSRLRETVVKVYGKDNASTAEQALFDSYGVNAKTATKKQLETIENEITNGGK